MNIVRVVASAPRDHDLGEEHALLTPWGEAIQGAVNEEAHTLGAASSPKEASDPASSEEAPSANFVPLNEYPRPQFRRDSYVSLNGWWNYAFLPINEKRTFNPPLTFEGRILVPFSPESQLSQVKRSLQPRELLWYERTVKVPAVKPGHRVLLHFEAVDYSCVCCVNGKVVGKHEGGYLPFEFDITNALLPRSAQGGELARAFEGEATVALCVWDPSDTSHQLRGKQKLERGGIWYTPQSGIWQAVWLEVVPAKRLVSLVLEPHAEEGVLIAKVKATGGEGLVRMYVHNAEGVPVAQASAEVMSGEDGEVEVELKAHLADVHLWSPEDPYLYNITLRFGTDCVYSYTAFRTVELRSDAQGRAKVFLNGKPLLVKGVLDQGYWSDGLMTAPADEALIFDIQEMKNLGFNMLRKHLKVESQRWYYHCDKLGMLVWQDMVSGGEAYDNWATSFHPTLWRRSWTNFDDTTPANQKKLGGHVPAYQKQWTQACLETIEHLRNHPSIVCWGLFNEGWGQFNARAITEQVHALDPTRLIDSVSGWYDQQCGHFFSVHNYFRSLKVYRDKPGRLTGFMEGRGPRAFSLSEFGGMVFPVKGHSMFDNAYGYGKAATLEAWRAAVREVLGKAEALEEKGLAVYVYTQLSDVEEETNGILTYDRRVNKLKEEASCQ
jgi:hypothetical protein